MTSPAGDDRITPTRVALPSMGALLVSVLVTAACAQLPVRIENARVRSTATTHATASLIFGTNLALFDSTDQVLKHPASQRLLKRAQVPIIRMPFRTSQGDVWEVEALRAIQYIGAVPLVIVHGPTDPNVLADDRRLIALVRGVFGDGSVYVEFGNEPDLAGIDVRRYIASWNAVIPALKAMAPTYRFVGPTLSSPDPAYLATFVRLANPRPDALSWHEYVCHSRDSDEYCMAHLDDWTAHIQGINQAVLAATGTTVPIMVTEWNLSDKPDARFANPSFMHAWTERALETLAANQPNGLLAAMQYCVTNCPQLNLVDSSDSLTPEGQVFFEALARSAATP